MEGQCNTRESLQAIERPVDVKPGWTTTEFWATIATTVANVIGFLSVVGLVGAEDAPGLTQMTTAAVMAIAAVIVNGFAIIQYIKSRTLVKQEATRLHLQRLALATTENRLEMRRLEVRAS